jgi:hypothetical protein
MENVMKKMGLSFAEALILAAVLTVTVATSKSDGTKSASYGAATNCSQATQNNIAITTSGSTITSPANINFTSFGLPTPEVLIGSTVTVSGEISAGVTRSCSPTTSTNNGATMYVYTCTDNSTPSCQVSFTAL